MRATVFDSSAVLALLLEQPGADLVETLLAKASESDHAILIGAVNWAEVLSVIARKHGDSGLAHARRFENTMPVEISPVDQEQAELAATLKNEAGLGLADAFVAALAKLRKADLVTGDLEFRPLEKEIKITWLNYK
jgi:PIN domain nuclease of toxin-antitoxin system